MGWNLTQGMDVWCLCVYVRLCVFVLSCVYLDALGRADHPSKEFYGL
jgi:hypothetical protein